MKITDSIRYIGVNDHQIDLFEGQYKVKNGMSYNSYAIMDEKIAIMDTVDRHFTKEWLLNISNTLGDKTPDYLIVQHMEPDHSANITTFMETYPDAVIVSSSKAFSMMNSFFGTDYAQRQLIVKEGDTLSLGKHVLTFTEAPMVHWPEVIVTYDSYEKVLFSADAFGKFGALDVLEDWEEEARRYYIGIVGKYGIPVQSLLKKVSAFDISMILPLHGPQLNENLGYFLDKYNSWSSYQPDKQGVVICYTSVYGHTKEAVNQLMKRIKENNVQEVKVFDLARDDMAEALSCAFAYPKLVLATTTYNGDVFPFMKEFIHHLLERNFQGRQLALIENGSWAFMAARVMMDMLAKQKNITYIAPTIQIRSALNENNKKELEKLADILAA